MTECIYVTTYYGRCMVRQTHNDLPCQNGRRRYAWTLDMDYAEKFSSAAQAEMWARAARLNPGYAITKINPTDHAGDVA